MQPFEKDWIFVQAAADELEDYLLSDNLYWPISASPGASVPGDVPRLTLGNLLLSLKRLHGFSLPEKQQREFEQAQQKIDSAQARWRAHWIKKSQEEVRSRLPRWQNFLQEIRSKNPPSKSEYAYNIRLRVILDLLMKQVEDPMPVEETALANMDQILRSRFQPDGFIWEEPLQNEFPQNPYWYLYGEPAAS